MRDGAMRDFIDLAMQVREFMASVGLYNATSSADSSIDSDTASRSAPSTSSTGAMSVSDVKQYVAGRPELLARVGPAVSISSWSVREVRICPCNRKGWYGLDALYAIGMPAHVCRYERSAGGCQGGGGHVGKAVLRSSDLLRVNSMACCFVENITCPFRPDQESLFGNLISKCTCVLSLRVGNGNSSPQHYNVLRCTATYRTIPQVGDGNINFVYIVSGPAGGLCIKQALPYVRCVGESWPLTQVRVILPLPCFLRYSRMCVRMCAAWGGAFPKGHSHTGVPVFIFRVSNGVAIFMHSCGVGVWAWAWVCVWVWVGGGHGAGLAQLTHRLVAQLTHRQVQLR